MSLLSLQRNSQVASYEMEKPTTRVQHSLLHPFRIRLFVFGPPRPPKRIFCNDVAAKKIAAARRVFIFPLEDFTTRRERAKFTHGQSSSAGKINLYII